MKPQKLLNKILSGSKNIKFSDFVNLVEAFGFRGILKSCGRKIEIGGIAMKDYHINIFYNEEDEGYIADIPDLKHCSAFGETPREALAEVEEAKELWLEAAKKEGKPVPEPRYRPVIYQVAV